MVIEIIKKLQGDILADWQQVLRQRSPGFQASGPALETYGSALLRRIADLAEGSGRTAIPGARDGEERDLEERADAGCPLRDVISELLLLRRWTRLEEAQRLLTEASALLADTPDIRITLDRLAHALAPKMADWCMIELTPSQGVGWNIGAAHRDPTRTDLLRELARRWPPNAENLRGQVLRTAQPVIIREATFEHISPKCQNDIEQRDLREMLQVIGLQSLIIVPLAARGRTCGTLLLASPNSRTFDAEDLNVAMDLAQRVALAADNALLYTEARTAARAREDILAIVSHDLKNPLQVIGLSTILLNKALESQDAHGAHRQLTILQSASRLMVHLIGDLLDAASLQTGRLSIQVRLCEVEPLVHEALAMVEEAARAKQLRIKVALAAHGCRVHCDHARVLQVFANLLGNAIKFCAEGASILIRARVKGREIRFSVSDTGPGIMPEDLAHIFDAYWSAERYRKQGSGLGLSITKSIVEMHGGRIWARSRPEKGTTIHFTLPVARDEV